ncbi:flagellar protein FliT [Pantoea sp. 1.19]|uniref:flagellar protein FliT n=1 Tax=Pantoea sp. 1.19 TaxID=1925589 RepID=UPI000948DE37|nr:flagellar protein FliT [Pantoea sp. 1.19]
MITSGLTALYQQALALSEELLALARTGEWDRLVNEEMRYLNAIEHLTRQQEVATLPADQQRQVRPILRALIANESTLRTLLTQRLDELRGLVEQQSRQQSVNHAYGSLAGNILYPGSGV